jgi:hypothetical protein
MAGLAATTLSIAMLAAMVLIGFGIKFALGTEHRKNGRLMVIAGLVLVANVLVWTV